MFKGINMSGSSKQIKKLLSNSKRIGMFFPPKYKKALILAPHPDDETIGCGGIISKLNNSQMDMTSVLFTYNEDELRGIEFKNAMKELNCKYYFLGMTDGQLKDQKEKIVGVMQQLIYKTEPDIIFTPYILDFNKDHKAISESLANLIYTKETLISMYEVWTPILYPNYYIDITSVFDKKNRAIMNYKSQESTYKLTNKTYSLNCLRAELLMRRNTTYMEAFKVFHSSEYKELVKALALMELL